MRIPLPSGGTATVSKDVQLETVEALDQMCKAVARMEGGNDVGGDGDFTKPERNIREALFVVFYEKDWTLEYRPPGAAADEDVDLERWKFVDRVIDTLRKQQSERAKP